MTGSSAMAGASRSFDCVVEKLQKLIAARQLRDRREIGGNAMPRAARRPSGKDRLVASATPGLTSTAGSGGSDSGADSTSPMPRMMRGRGSRQTGTSAPVARAAA